MKHDLRVGDIIWQKSVTQVYPNMQLTYKVPKKKLFITLLLGEIDVGCQKDTDVEKLLNELGWYKKDDNS